MQDFKARIGRQATLITLIICISLIGTAHAYTNNQIANAIYKAENSKSHPYGILTHYKHTTPRQACINTINSAIKRFNKQNKETDFIHFLSLTYCPTKGKHLTNDEKGLNKNWLKNVNYFLLRGI
jgi:hypothetical protein